MGTNGLVSVTKKGHVLLKVVTGQDGYNARQVAQALREKWPVTVDEAYDLACKHGFGNSDSLVVLSPDSHRCDSLEDGEDLGPLYRDTFNQPRFNPRWEHGTAAHTHVVRIRAERPGRMKALPKRKRIAT